MMDPSAAGVTGLLSTRYMVYTFPPGWWNIQIASRFQK